MNYLEREFFELLGNREALHFLESGGVDGFWFWDLEKPENEWLSPGFCKSLGFDNAKRDVPTNKWRDLIFPEDGARARENFRRHCDDPDHPYDQLVRYRTGDGGTLTVRCRGFAIRENGTPKRMLGAHTIVHDSRSDPLEREWSQLLDISSDAIFAWSEADGIIRWNQGAVSLYGIPEKTALGRDPFALTQAILPVPWEDICATINAGETWSGDIERRTSHGNRVVTSTRIQRVEISDNRMLLLQVDRDETARFDAEQQRKLLLAEMHHRVKNLFAVMKGIISLSARHEKSSLVFAEKLADRITSMASAHFLHLQENQKEGTTLEELAQAVLAPYVDQPDRLRLSGPITLVPTEAINPLCMILHELATNALKHGAWANRNGEISVSWHTTGQPANATELRWIETIAGHEKPQPGKPNFGSHLIDISTQQLGGKLTRTWTDNGLMLSFDFCLEQAQDQP